MRYVDPDGHQTTVADRLRNAAVTVREAAATVARAAEPVFNGASSAFPEDIGLGGNPGPQSSVGRGIGHTVALAESAAEILVGGGAAVGGGAEAVATSPAVVTVVGAAAPAVGVGVAVGGVVTAAHGVLMGANTLNNIFNKNSAGQQSSGEPPGQTSAGRLTDQNGRPLGPSGKPTIHQNKFPNTKAAKDAARNAGQGAPIDDEKILTIRGCRAINPVYQAGR